LVIALMVSATRLPPIDVGIAKTVKTSINSFSSVVTSSQQATVNCGYQSVYLTGGTDNWFLSATIVPIDNNILPATISTVAPFSLNSYT
jgi:hypothetical protein